MPSAKVTSKGQITIPVEIRNALGLKPGTRVDFFATETGGFMLRAKTGSIMDLEGVVPSVGRIPSQAEMDQAVMDSVAAEYLSGMRRTDEDEEAA